MGLFWTDIKPRVTEKEFQKVRSELAAHGFTLKQRDRIAEIFRSDMYGIREKDEGISAQEIDNGIAWMREHMDEHHIPEDKIAILESQLKSRL